MQYSSSTESNSYSRRDSPSRWGNKDDKGYSYKKSSYQYSSTGNNSASYHNNKSANQNIDQLDALLEDLKNERQISTRERELLPNASYRTIERETPGTAVTTTRVIKTTKHSGAPHQFSDDIETFSTPDYSTLRSTANYSSFQDSLKRDEYKPKERSYGIGHSPGGGSTHYESKSKIYESNRALNSTELLPAPSTINTTVKTTSSSNIEKELQDIALGDDILPVPGTKVTTTVRTYTYEIPAGSSNTTNTINRSQRLNYNSLQQHDSNVVTTHSNYAQPRPTVPQTITYNTESYSTLNRNQTERPIVTNQTYEIREHKETNTLHNTSTGGLPREVPVPIGPESPGSTGPGPNRTIVYNINKTNNIHTTIDEPPTHLRYTTPSPQSPHSPSNLPPGGTTNRYFYKETSNVVNTIHGPPGTNEPLTPQRQPPVAAHPHPQPHTPLGNGYPPNTSYTYNYSSTSTTNNTNNRTRGPDYGTPSPFPVDGVEYPTHPTNGNPPQRVEELMQSFNNNDGVDRGDFGSPIRKREIETAVASPNQQHVPTVNKAGKEVYYPPGHDTMIMKREEMSAGSAAGGRWAKGSGMYEYESGYKSKTKTKSGGAMVPVCLPLCCAMPCSIM